MTGPTQAELDEQRRKTYLINRDDVLSIIKQHFQEVHDSLKIRSTYDQTILGGCITCLESEIKKDLKALKMEVK